MKTRAIFWEIPPLEMKGEQAMPFVSPADTVIFYLRSGPVFSPGHLQGKSVSEQKLIHTQYPSPGSKSTHQGWQTKDGPCSAATKSARRRRACSKAFSSPSCAHHLAVTLRDGGF